MLLEYPHFAPNNWKLTYKIEKNNNIDRIVGTNGFIIFHFREHNLCGNSSI